MNHHSRAVFAASIAVAVCGLLLVPLRASAEGKEAVLSQSYVFLYANPGQIYPGNVPPYVIPVNAPTNIECAASVTLLGDVVFRFTDNHIRISKVNDLDHWAVVKKFSLPPSFFGPYKYNLPYKQVLVGEYKMPWTFHEPGQYRIECSLDAGGYPNAKTFISDYEAKPGTGSYYGYATVTVTGKPNKLTASRAKRELKGSFHPSTKALAAAKHLPRRPLVPAPKTGMRATRTAHPTLPFPRLAVIAATAKVQPRNCREPKPALIARVTIKNSGGPLAIDKGTVFVHEVGGDNLMSAGIPLPAMYAGQTEVVKIPAITLRPYSSLPGKHQLRVIVNNVFARGKPSFKKPSPFRFYISFPRGYCQSSTLHRTHLNLGAPRPLRLRRPVPKASPPSIPVR